MAACQWCGDLHGVERLCQRAQRGMTRRSFCFLFGAGLAGTVIGPSLSETVVYASVDPTIRPGRLIRITAELLEDSAIDWERFRSNIVSIDGKLHTLTAYWDT